MTQLAVPNFRLPKRLISWMQINGVKERIPAAEKVFFKDSIDLSTRAWGLVGYARQVGKLTPDMEKIIATTPEACVGYAKTVNLGEVPPEVIDACGRHVNFIIKMAGALHRRLPHLEDRIESPPSYVAYALELRTRIPELEDRILFSGIHHPTELADAALKLVESLETNGYGAWSENGPARDLRLRELIKTSRDAVLSFMQLHNQRGMKLEPEFQEVLKGSGLHLSKLAEHLRRRLPEELERSWTGAPKELVQYAIRWVRGPLHKDLEDVLIGDEEAAYAYAFQVMRGFASPKLSDSLHAFMLMKSFENPDNRKIKEYVAECDRAEEMKRLVLKGIEDSEQKI